MNAQISLGIQKRYGADAQRMYKAVQIVEAKQLKKLPNGNYDVVSQSDSNHHYQVNPVYECCNCADCEKSGNVCKHLLAWKLQGASASDMEAKAEQARGLEIAENLITRYGTAEERIERGYQKAWAKAISDMGLNCPKCGSPDIFEYTSFDGQLLHCKKCDNNFTPKTKKQKSVLLPIQKRDVIAEREQLAREQRKAQPKTEWLEELDYV